ncbi:pyruvate dehydrogenase E2 component (dihydrolipoamide acetyltransferase) [Microbotryum lychnidis-dioicae p1A1 Lamole]|uniref:Acetyltransferase component of pyruvate dehydrogenase complex n=1 Tax=Microbotryum lychnidis-dioicae (strain p1A1 Lamole / MvSl-1064) TaxID=683840 RepID=U5H0D7_USTV1|nr:pyruvate dehydrogenase E2 component (dihydrolipoamide acetyltransferase) [Microbotryum lychnidis-dioicae p1A1 Lamole]|eukprot:KDE09159.1 pyruvate dehydrogenase E2 component (dihydrolipoamide acetyltransferase) [Microbotryum lychnidis-dioicae p1A1 Lamole]
MIRQLVQQRARSLARSSLSSPRYLHATSRSHALTKFMFPAMSPTMTEGGIASWKKKEGEAFAPGDVLLEIETDKATMDVEAQDEGVLGKIIVGDGAKGVKVGSIVAILAEEGDDVSVAAIKALTEDGAGEAAPAEVVEDKPQEKASETPEPKKQETKSETPSAPKKESSMQPSGDHPVILASPLAKRLALEQGIPLAKIKGSGPGGRIVKADIESYKPEAPKAAAASSSSSAPAPSTSSAAPAKFTDTPVSNMRRTIASRLTDSKSGTPHYYLTTEINMDRVAKLRDVFNSAAKSAEAAGGVNDGVKTGTKLSFNDFVVKASALALNDVPEVNSGWHGDFVRQYHTADISVAVATPNGLITPIIHDVGAKGLATVSTLTKQLAGKARDGKLKPEEYQGGSFTISNLGMFGVESFTAIINPPQSCILAVGATEKKLVLDPESEKGFKEVSVMKVTLSCDHRVVDGAIGARWLKSFKAYLESPLSFML